MAAEVAPSHAPASGLHCAELLRAFARQRSFQGMNLVRSSCAALLLVAPLFAQTPAAPKLHIPAGDWTVRDLLTHTEQALRTPIAADAAELAQATAERIRLQFPLALDPAHGQEALAALLSTRGLLLARGEGGRPEVRATPKGKPDWLRERAVASPVQDLLDHPFRHGVVRTELRTSVDVPMLNNMLRISAAGGAATPICEAAKEGIVCIGTSDAVRHAIAQVAAMDPQFATTLQPAGPVSIVSTAKGVPVELPAGEHRIADVVDLLARCSGFNIVLSPALAASAAKIKVAKAQQFDWQRGPNGLTTLLWQHHVLLLELDVRHGLYEVVLVDNPKQAPAVTRAAARTVEQALAAADCVLYIGVRFKAQHLDSTQLMNHVRLTMQAAAQESSVFTTVLAMPDGLLITGLSPVVAELLQKLQAADQPRRG
jgi:hypothetical protein